MFLSRVLVAALLTPSRPGVVIRVTPPPPFVPLTPVRPALTARLPPRVVWETGPGGAAVPAPSPSARAAAIITPVRPRAPGAVVSVKPPLPLVTFAAPAREPLQPETGLPPARRGTVVTVRPPRLVVTFAAPPREPLVVRRAPPPFPGHLTRPGGNLTQTRVPAGTFPSEHKTIRQVRRVPPGRAGSVLFVQPPRPLVTFETVAREARLITRVPPGRPGSVALVRPPLPLVRFGPPRLLQVQRTPPGRSGASWRVQPPRVFVAPPLGSAPPAKTVRRVPPGTGGSVVFSRRPLPFVPPKPPPARVVSFLPPGRRGTALNVAPPRPLILFGAPSREVRTAVRVPPARPGSVTFSQPPRRFVTPPLRTAWPSQVIRRSPPGTAGSVSLTRPPRLTVVFGPPHATRPVSAPPLGRAGLVTRAGDGLVQTRVPAATFPFENEIVRRVTPLPPGRAGSVIFSRPPRLTVTFKPRPAAFVARPSRAASGTVTLARPPRAVVVLVTSRVQPALIVRGAVVSPPRPVLLLAPRRVTPQLPAALMTARIVRRQVFPYPGGVLQVQPVRLRAVPGLPRSIVAHRVPPAAPGSFFISPVSRQNAIRVAAGNPRAKLTLRPAPTATLVLKEG